MTQKIDAERLKESADIERIVGQYIELKRGGNSNERVGLCPFHKEDTPSFTLNTDKQMWYCFGCSEGGDVFNFVSKIEGLSAFGDAVTKVAELVNFVPPAEAPVKAPPKKAEAAPAPAGKIVAVYPYTDEHGELLYEVCRIEPGKNGRAKDFTQRHYDAGGKVVWGMDGVRRVLYRLTEVLKAETVWVVEGEKDVHTLEGAGLVATTNSGGASQKWQAEWTAALAGKHVIVIPDNDEPGKKHGAAVVKELTGKAADVTLVELPVGKDVTEYFAAGKGLSDLEAMVSEIRLAKTRDELERRGLLDPAEIIECVGLNAFLSPKHGLETGFARWDEMTLGMHAGELIILAARPAAGKTALALNVACNVAARGNPVAIFSLEMSRESLLTRLVCARARVDQLKFRSGRLDREERARVNKALGEICEMPLYIDDYAGCTLEGAERKLAELIKRRGLALVVLDYLQLMTGSSRESRNQEVNSLSRGLKVMARKLGVPFLVLSQLSRAVEQRQGDHRPQLSDLRDSGGIEQDCDQCAFIYREELYKPDREDLRGLAELIIAKQRNGPVGRVNLVFLKEQTKFEDRAEGGMGEP
jgi:replicative DNA helicase